MKRAYLVKICKDGEILDVKHYKKFENIVAEISNKKIFESIPDEIARELEFTPKIYYGSVDERNNADDFEFRYKNGLYVYAGKISCEDEKGCNYD